VHVLDDGFQHFGLERDIDLLVVDPADLEKPRPLPAGRLREPLEAARLACGDRARGGAGQAEDTARQLGIERVFRAADPAEAPRLIEPAGRVVTPAAGTRVLALAGIARPARFFAELKEAGWVVGRTGVSGSSPHTARDVARIVRAARDARAVMVMTTEKDLMRLLPLRAASSGVGAAQAECRTGSGVPAPARHAAD
jgi:tetraacyldisaccharide 4'-kinase